MTVSFPDSHNHNNHNNDSCHLVVVVKSVMVVAFMTVVRASFFFFFSGSNPLKTVWIRTVLEMKVESDAFGTKYHCYNREDIKLLLKKVEELHNTISVVNNIAMPVPPFPFAYSSVQDHSLKLLESALRDRAEAGKAIVVYIPCLIQGWTIDP